MTAKDFKFFREKFQKTQMQMADIVGISQKAVQSFEQGWRKVPAYVERQVLFLLAMKYGALKPLSCCWDQVNCPPKMREGCPAWEFNSGHICWFINGTICRGKAQRSWNQKMNLCKKCKVFNSFLSSCS